MLMELRMQEVCYRSRCVKDKRGRKQDRVGKAFRPQFTFDICERKDSRKQNWAEIASHHNLDLMKYQPTQ